MTAHKEAIVAHVVGAQPPYAETHADVATAHEVAVVAHVEPSRSVRPVDRLLQYTWTL